MIAGSRIIDARHHPFDVMFGSALGILCGWACYRQYFPPVSHTWEKGRAYPMRTWGVPLRHPNGTMGTDGQFYSRNGGTIDRTANAMGPDYDEDRQALVGTNMEPIRGNPAYSSDNAPSFSQFQQRHPPSGRGSPSDDDTDYEQVRMKMGATTTTSMPSQGLPRQTSNPQATGENNQFRDQLDRNQSMRAVVQDEQDVAFQKPVR